MKISTSRPSQYEASVVSQAAPAREAKNIQVLYLGATGKLTYASSHRTVSKKLADKLGISKFNFL